MREKTENCMNNKPAKNIISINLNKENVVLYEVDHNTHIPVLKITVVYPEVVINNKKMSFLRSSCL